jgi:hypothetical protein
MEINIENGDDQTKIPSILMAEKIDELKVDLQKYKLFDIKSIFNTIEPFNEDEKENEG